MEFFDHTIFNPGPLSFPKKLLARFKIHVYHRGHLTKLFISGVVVAAAIAIGLLCSLSLPIGVLIGIVFGSALGLLLFVLAPLFTLWQYRKDKKKQYTLKELFKKKWLQLLTCKERLLFCQTVQVYQSHLLPSNTGKSKNENYPTWTDEEFKKLTDFFGLDFLQQCANIDHAAWIVFLCKYSRYKGVIQELFKNFYPSSEGLDSSKKEFLDVLMMVAKPTNEESPEKHLQSFYLAYREYLATLKAPTLNNEVLDTAYRLRERLRMEKGIHSPKIRKVTIPSITSDELFDDPDQEIKVSTRESPSSAIPAISDFSQVPSLTSEDISSYFSRRSTSETRCSPPMDRRRSTATEFHQTGSSTFFSMTREKSPPSARYTATSPPRICLTSTHTSLIRASRRNLVHPADQASMISSSSSHILRGNFSFSPSQLELALSPSRSSITLFTSHGPVDLGEVAPIGSRRLSLPSQPHTQDRPPPKHVNKKPLALLSRPELVRTQQNLNSYDQQTTTKHIAPENPPGVVIHATI